MALIEKNIIGKEVLGDYDYIYPFKEGLARVKRKDGWYNFINEDVEKEFNNCYKKVWINFHVF